MGRDSIARSGLMEFGLAERTMPGEAVSGDRHVVRELSNGLLLAVIDGLGHGPEAGAAADIAVATLVKNAGKPVIALIQFCHGALMRSRGAVMCIVSIDSTENQLTWLSVGNVSAHLIRGPDSPLQENESPVSRGGIVGGQLPTLREAGMPIYPGDLVIMATDGIRDRFIEDVVTADEPQTIADRAMAKHAKGADDALILVARYMGAPK